MAVQKTGPVKMFLWSTAAAVGLGGAGLGVKSHLENEHLRGTLDSQRAAHTRVLGDHEQKLQSMSAALEGRIKAQADALEEIRSEGANRESKIRELEEAQRAQDGSLRGELNGLRDEVLEGSERVGKQGEKLSELEKGVASFDLISRDTIERVMPSAVMLYATSPTDKSKYSGFIFRDLNNKRYICTVAHGTDNDVLNFSGGGGRFKNVLRGILNLPEGEFKFTLTPAPLDSGKYGYIPTKYGDVAVFKVPNDLDKKLDEKEVEQGIKIGVNFASLLKPTKYRNVFTIGNPKGNRFSVEHNYVSAVREISLDDGPDLTMLQLDKGVNPGNSGGPVFNLEGECIGMAELLVQYPTPKGFATSIQTIKPQIEAFGVPVLTADEKMLLHLQERPLSLIPPNALASMLNFFPVTAPEEDRHEPLDSPTVKALPDLLRLAPASPLGQIATAGALSPTSK